MKVYQTPGTAHKIQVHERDESKYNFKEEQTLLRSGVGMLLYLVMYSRLNITNPVRE